MRATLKATLRILSALIVAPVVAADFLLRPMGSDHSFAACTQFLSLIPGRFGSYLRLAYLRIALPEPCEDGSIGFGTLFSQRDTRLGNGIYIGPQCNIGSCEIGDDTLIASGVHIMSGTQQHNFDALETPIRDQGGAIRRITIGKDCWIGNAALIMADVGDHCVIGAGSVVTTPLPPFSVAVGNPARVLRTRHPDQQDTQAGESSARPATVTTTG